MLLTAYSICTGILPNTINMFSLSVTCSHIIIKIKFPELVRLDGIRVPKDKEIFFRKSNCYFPLHSRLKDAGRLSVSNLLDTTSSKRFVK